MNQVDYRHYFKGRVWKNEGSQKVQEVGMYRRWLWWCVFFDDMNRVDVYHHRQDERWRGIRPKASGAPATCELLGNYALKNVAAACVTKMQS